MDSLFVAGGLMEVALVPFAQDLVTRRIPTTLAMLQEKLDNIRGAVTMGAICCARNCFEMILTIACPVRVLPFSVPDGTAGVGYCAPND
jgi:hypothetical protein